MGRLGVNENRIMAFARFFALKLVTAKEIGKYCGCHGQTAAKVLNENGVFRMPMINAVDRLQRDGLSFYAAINILGVTVEQYAHNYKVRKARGLL